MTLQVPVNAIQECINKIYLSTDIVKNELILGQPLDMDTLYQVMKRMSHYRQLD